jgi:hypothetical protein
LFLLCHSEKIIRRIGLDDGIGRALGDGIFGDGENMWKRMYIQGTRVWGMCGKEDKRWDGSAEGADNAGKKMENVN